mgnify:CR=1 FL=1
MNLHSRKVDKGLQFDYDMTSVGLYALEILTVLGRDSGTLPAGGRDPDPYLQSGKGCDRYKDRTG